MSEEQAVENKEEVKMGPPITYIDLFGAIGRDTLKTFSSAMLNPADPIKADDHIEISISTPGGISTYSTAMVDILHSKHNLNGTIVCLGLCASAGWAILGSKLTTLAYPGTIFMNHGGSYKYENSKLDFILNNLMVEERVVAMTDQYLIDKSGLSKEEHKKFFTGDGSYHTAMELLWVGERGILDGIIVKESPEIGWVVLTKEGLKQWSSQFKGHLRDRPLLADSVCEKYGLKQQPPVKPKAKKISVPTDELVFSKK